MFTGVKCSDYIALRFFIKFFYRVIISSPTADTYIDPCILFRIYSIYFLTVNVVTKLITFVFKTIVLSTIYTDTFFTNDILDTIISIAHII